MNLASEPERSKRCKLIAEVLGPPGTDYKFCVYKCKDWRGGSIPRRIQKGFQCPEEIDWWDAAEIPGALPD